MRYAAGLIMGLLGLALIALAHGLGLASEVTGIGVIVVIASAMKLMIS